MVRYRILGSCYQTVRNIRRKWMSNMFFKPFKCTQVWKVYLLNVGVYWIADRHHKDRFLLRYQKDRFLPRRYFNFDTLVGTCLCDACPHPLTSETNPLQLSPNIRSPLIFHVPTSMKKVFKRPNILHMCLVHVHFVILHLLLVYMHKCSMPIAWHFWSLNVWNKICSSWSLQTSKTNILPM